MIVNLITAVDELTHGIGYKGTMPWKNKEDMQWFKKMTTGYACIMGWTTFVSLDKPLTNRLNIVISHDKDATTYFSECDNSNVRNARSPEEALKIAEDENYTTVFVIGGASIYKQFLEKDLIDTVYMDVIDNDVTKFDTFFPFDSMYQKSGHQYWTIQTIHISDDSKNHYHMFHRIRKKNNDVDSQYLELLNNIFFNGQKKNTRAGDTLSIFGKQLRFNAMNCLPTLTTKKVYTKGCITELLWFISGNTNIKYLVENNCHIWDDDAYRHYIDLIKRHNETVAQLTQDGWAMYLETPIDDSYCTKEEFIEKVKKGETLKLNIEKGEFNSKPKTSVYRYGDLGPVYGKQWNDWGGVNQIKELINKLKTNPDDRRLIISAWNVGELKNMALPPCHYMTQWYVSELTEKQRISWLINTKGYKDDYMEHLSEAPTKGLSVMWNQRSVDTCLGLPYNILSYSIFLYLVAQCVDMIPFEVICNLGDVHVYENQIEAAKEQLLRNPYLFEMPTLKLNPNIKDIWGFKLEDIKIENYKSYPAIKFPLSVGL